MTKKKQIEDTLCLHKDVKNLHRSCIYDLDLNTLREANHKAAELKCLEKEDPTIDIVEREIENLFDDIPLGGFDIPPQEEDNTTCETNFDPFETISEEVVRANKEKEQINMRKRKRLEYIQSLLESSNQASKINLTITKISTLIQKYLMNNDKMKFEDLQRLLAKGLFLYPHFYQHLYIL